MVCLLYDSAGSDRKAHRESSFDLNAINSRADMLFSLFMLFFKYIGDYRREKATIPFDRHCTRYVYMIYMI